MAASNDLSEWLQQGNEPVDATQANDLHVTLAGNSMGQYVSKDLGKGLRRVTGPGSGALIFKKTDAAQMMSDLTERFGSEPGATLDGERRTFEGNAEG